MLPLPLLTIFCIKMGSCTVFWIAFVFLSEVAGVLGNRRDLDVYEGHVIPESHGWNYGDNAFGPENWPDLFPFQCAGLYQSPINIRTYETVYQPHLREFIFTPPTPASKFVVHNNGHYIQVNTVGNFYMYGGGLQHWHTIEQFHFHWGDNSQHGAEHTVNGIEYPIELHIVSWNIDKYTSLVEATRHPDGIAVLGVLFEVSKYDNPVIEPIIQAIPHVRDPDSHTDVDIPAMSIRNLLPYADNLYYRYHGSLTTPICLESVTWTVYEQKLPISERQLNVFRQVLTSAGSPQNGHGHGLEQPGYSEQAREQLVNNYRPVQSLNGRTVHRSFPFLPKTPY